MEALMPLQPSVIKAWPPHVKKFEGQLTWMYLDTKNKVTTGTGNLIDSVSAAQALPWYKGSRRATKEEIKDEWNYVKSRKDLSKRSGWAYDDVTKLRLHQSEVDRLLTETTKKFWSNLSNRWPILNNAPADAQLVALDMAWQNGPGFLDLKSNGKWVWPNMRAAWQDGDWSKAADSVPGSGSRAVIRKRLFKNAGAVVKLNLDRSKLWNMTTPFGTAQEVPVKETPTEWMINMKDVYSGTSKDQALKPGEQDVKINDDGGVSIIGGANKGVDLLASVAFNREPPKGTELLWRIVDYKSGDNKIAHNRQSESALQKCSINFKGAIPADSGKDREMRLRVVCVVPAGVTDLVITNVQITGWKM